MKYVDGLIGDPMILKTKKGNVIWYFLFFIFLLIIDLIILFYYQQSYYLMLPKIFLNVATLIYLIVKKEQFQENFMNIWLFLIKLLSVTFSFLIDDCYFQIFLFLLEEYNISRRSQKHSIQRFFVKIGFIALMIVEQSLINIVIGICHLVLEILGIIIFIQYSQISLNKKQHNQIQYLSNRETFSSQESNYLSLIKISKSQQKIIYKNQNFCKYFREIHTEEELNDLILDKLIFQIVSKNSEVDKNLEIDQQNTKINRHHLNQDFSIKQVNSRELLLSNVKGGKSLSGILHDCEFERLGNLKNEQTHTFEFFSEYQRSNNLIVFTGEIIVIDEEDEVVLTLIDITKQHKLQEKKIKDQFKTKIIQSFSHELRTPLNSSLNFLQCCENDKTLTLEVQKNFILPAINALRLQSYLINDIIDFSSLSADNLELDITNTTIAQIVDELNQLFKSALEMKKLAFYVDLTQNDVMELGTDYSRLMQILANLLQNSIKYSNQGTIIVKITSPSLNYIKISIKDEGQGIDMQGLQQIRKLLQNVEEKTNFSDFETWHGFGILISSMLILKLKPEGQKSLQIKSDGITKGTKVSFFIQNYTTTNQVISLYKESRKTSQSRFGLSSKKYSMNGSVVQLSDPDCSFSSKSRNFQRMFSKFTSKKMTIQKSPDNSSKSCSFTDVNFELKIHEFNNLYPFLFHENQILSQRNEKLELQNKIINYEDIANKEDQENEKWLRQFLSSRNCTCNKILSIDDEIFNQKSIQFLLKQKGIETILAYNGQQALQIVQETQKCSSTCCLFILILMDYQMPIMNGPEVTINLRNLMDSNKIPKINIVGLTAFNSKNDIEKCLQSGMSAVLTKPLKIKELLEILQQL